MSALLNNLSFADRYIVMAPYLNTASKDLEILNLNMWSFLQQQFQDIHQDTNNDKVGFFQEILIPRIVGSK